MRRPKYEEANKMRANLYIEKLDREDQYRGFRVSDDAFEPGYFRDLYNGCGLLSFMWSNLNRQFSWWIFSDTKEWFTKKGNMTVEGAKEFRKILAEAIEELASREKHILKVIDYKKSNGLPVAEFVYKAKRLKKGDSDFYLWRLYELIKFLDKAIKLGSEIIWSV
jgi:hypothetical protein